MRLSILGPAPPLRGGIVTYLAMLAKKLEERGNSVFWASFKKQYPRWLFPGSKQEGEVAPWLVRESSPKFVPWSPLSWYRTYRDIARAEVESVVMKYWLPYFAPGYACVGKLLKRNTDTRLIYILDNVYPHEKQPFANALSRAALGLGDGYVAQSMAVRDELFSLLPETSPDSVRYVPHPIYDFGAPGEKRPTKKEARKLLGLPLDKHVALFFGFIKPYKGVDCLIEASSRIGKAMGDDLIILIVGDVYGDETEYSSAIAKYDQKDIVDFRPGFVPDSAVEPYFVASDVVVLPYRTATQSGIAQIAFNYSKPVITTEVGGIPEVVLDGETGMVLPPGNPIALADAIIGYFEEDMEKTLADGISRGRSKYSWDSLAEAIEVLSSKK